MTRTVYTPTHIHTNTVSIYTIGILIGIIIPSESDREGDREKACRMLWEIAGNCSKSNYYYLYVGRHIV